MIGQHYLALAYDAFRACPRLAELFACGMDATESRRIEIFAPFGEAFELMQNMLFRPFDLGKWFVIGFAAWLATFFGGMGFGYRWNFRDHHWNWRFEHHGGPIQIHNAPAWAVPFMVLAVLIVLAVVALFIWINSRSRFVFTDCMVRNRGAIVAPWKEYRVEGDRYFVFQIVISFCSMIIFGGLALLWLVGDYTGQRMIPLALLIFLGVCLGLIAIVVLAIMHFMVPVMYRQRCSAGAAFGQVWSLIASHPATFTLLGLFYLVLAIAAGMIACLVTCVTCCIAAIPYIGTVILLPVVIVLYGFALCFLRQFGDPYDVWAIVRREEAPPLPPSAAMPPVQEPPLSPPPTPGQPPLPPPIT